MIISVDFDDTCTVDGYPFVGYYIGAQYVLKRLSDLGHNLLLHTCRMDSTINYDGVILSVNPLKQALSWFSSNNIPVTMANGKSKPYADLYIDDRALNVPTIPYKSVTTSKSGKFVDWISIARELYTMKVITFSDYIRLVPQITSDLLSLPNSIKIL